MAEPEFRDIIGLMLEADPNVDTQELLTASYEWASRLAIALLHRTGEVRLPENWHELTDGFQIVSEPMKDGRWRVRAVRRGEVTTDTREVQAEVQRRLDRRG